MKILRGIVIFAVIGIFCIAAVFVAKPDLPDELSGHLPWIDQKEETAPVVPEGSTFRIRFFDVGEADAALVECDGHYMMIDGGNPEDSGLIHAYLKEHKIRKLDCVICSHAHADHAGGLAGALADVSVKKAYAPVTTSDIWAFKSFVLYLNEQKKKITVPTPGDSFSLGGAEVTFLGPVDMSLAEENENNSSLIVRIEYGKTSFLFTGDAEIAEEQSVAGSWGVKLQSTVLKAGHHGSYTSSIREFLDLVQPKYCVISVGADNEHDHPHDTTLDRLSEYARKIYRTDHDGSIECSSDGQKVTFETEKQ